MDTPSDTAAPAVSAFATWGMPPPRRADARLALPQCWGRAANGSLRTSPSASTGHPAPSIGGGVGSRSEPGEGASPKWQVRLPPPDAPGVTVIGAGVIGLTVAVRLAEAGWAVNVVARAFSPDTTSDIAAAVWYPFRAGPPAAVARWARHSYGVFGALAGDPTTGVAWVEGREFAHGPLSAAPWHADVDGFRVLGADEVPAPFHHGHAFRAPVVQMPLYLAWLRACALGLGVRLATADVTPAALAARLAAGATVVNATGLGARELVGDGALYAIRGQIVRVAPGHAAHFVQATQPPQPVTYIIPRADCTVLGGTTDVGREDVAPDALEAEAIRARCVALMPSLAGAAVLGHAVGLRPGRDAVRLEGERVGPGRLVHCYGHGGAGVTLSWGCAADVVALVGDRGAREPVT